MNKQLIQWTSDGYAPTLLYDDNGHWAVSFSGMINCGVPEAQTFCDCIPLIWKGTPQEAVDAAIGHENEL